MVLTPAMTLALGSLAVGLGVLVLKTLAWWITGSAALFSDALESSVNVVAAGAALAAIRLAEKPADADHPYGHHKAEFLSAVFEGVMIVIAALLILHQAARTFLDPVPLTAPVEGLMVNGLATLINASWCWLLITRGRRLKSPALVADGRHLLADVVTSAGVALGLVLAILTGWWVLDPLLAALVALNVLWSGSRLVRESVGGLMDEAVPDETMTAIREAIAGQAGLAVEAHDIRTRHAGRATFIDFHLVVPGETSVHEAHEVCDRIEAALKSAVPDANVTIHVEPENKAKTAAAGSRVLVME